MALHTFQHDRRGKISGAEYRLNHSGGGVPAPPGRPKNEEVEPLSTCKGCGKEIKWIRTIGGKKMPVDPEGVFVIACDGSERFVTDEGAVISGRSARLNEIHNQTPLAYVPHWKTCPKAANFRQKRR